MQARRRLRNRSAQASDFRVELSGRRAGTLRVLRLRCCAPACDNFAILPEHRAANTDDVYTQKVYAMAHSFPLLVRYSFPRWSEP